MDDTPASRDKFFAILDGAFAAGVAAVTVHGRTVRQRYLRPGRLGFPGRRSNGTSGTRTILGSGDLFSAEDCLEMLAQTGVDGVIVARGAIGNPWIFQQVRALAAGQPLPPPPSVHEQREVIREHYRLAEELYGEDRCGPLMRKFGIKYSALHPQFLAVRTAFVESAAKPTGTPCWTTGTATTPPASTRARSTASPTTGRRLLFLPGDAHVR